MHLWSQNVHENHKKIVKPFSVEMCSNSLLDTLKRTMSSYVEIKDIPSFPLMPPSQIVLLSKKDLEICKMELMDILSEPDEEEDALLEVLLAFS